MAEFKKILVVLWIRMGRPLVGIGSITDNKFIEINV